MLSASGSSDRRRGMGSRSSSRPLCTSRFTPRTIDNPFPPGKGAEAKRKRDRKSTRLNSSHGYISYAVFCLKKKKKKTHLYYSLTTMTEKHTQELTIEMKSIVDSD